jgi:transcription termination/antitermination protein NusG
MAFDVNTIDVEQWYAIGTRARHEQVARNQLVSKHIETFLPTVTRWSRWKDRRKQVAWPLFPGYCFARFDLADRQSVLTCQGVAGIVSFDGQPVPVPEVEINSVRLLIAGPLAFDPCPLLTEGAPVMISAGPLQGVVGRLLSKDFHHATVVLSVGLIAQALRVEVHAADIRPY